MAPPIPGWPWLQRLNFIMWTVGGGCLGFYVQNKYMHAQKQKLIEEVPLLNEKLEKLTARRLELERAVRDAGLAKTR